MMLTHNQLRDTALIISALRLTHQFREPSEEEVKSQQRVAERAHNRLEALRTLLFIYEWRYALLPIGILEMTRHHYEGDYGALVTFRQLHVFGFRVARWVIETRRYRLEAPRPKARLRLRPRRKKSR